VKASSNSDAPDFIRSRNSYYLSLAIAMSYVKEHGSTVVAGASQTSTSQGFACIPVGHWQNHLFRTL